MSRRNFIVWYLGGLMAAVGVALIAPILIYIYPPQDSSKPQDLKVTLDTALDELKDGEAVKFGAPKNAGFLMKDGGGDNAPGDIAFSGYAVKVGSAINVFAINCSHLGCSIALNKDAKRFDCPCHGSQFNLDGSVLHGPAAAALSHLQWKQGASGKEILVQGVSVPGVG